MTESPLNTFFKSLIKNLLFAAKCIEPLLRFALQALKGDLLGTRAIVKRQGKHAFVQAFYNPLKVISDWKTEQQANEIENKKKDG